MPDTKLDRYREKWREAPKGSDADGRVYSTELLKLPDGVLLAAWEQMAARRHSGEHGWVGPLYGDSFRTRAVLELGSGLGFDGLRFATLGARWTFADIVPDNLEVIGRVAGLKGLGERVSFHLIGDDLSFDGLPDYDAIWVFGSELAGHANEDERHVDVITYSCAWQPGGFPVIFPEIWSRQDGRSSKILSRGAPRAAGTPRLRAC